MHKYGIREWKKKKKRMRMRGAGAHYVFLQPWGCIASGGRVAGGLAGDGVHV